MKIQTSFENNFPTLYIVPTPIGNLKDITFRALEVLKEVDAVFCEDTRRTLVLLNHFGIQKPLFRYEKFNEKTASKKIIAMLKEGKNIALVSDAGTPGISDPLFEIIKTVKEENSVNVVPLPGPVAFVPALICSTFQTNSFTFLGFLPRKKQEAMDTLFQYIERKETLIIYESPHRLTKTLELLKSVFKSREIMVARELTKLHETFYWFDLVDENFSEIQNLGEFVIIIKGSDKPKIENNLSPNELFLNYHSQGFSDMEAIKLTAKTLGKPKSEIYKEVKINEKNK